MFAAGVTPQGARDALFIAAIFNAIDRLADAFGFAIPDEAGFEARAKALLRLATACRECERLEK